ALRIDEWLKLNDYNITPYGAIYTNPDDIEKNIFDNVIVPEFSVLKYIDKTILDRILKIDKLKLKKVDKDIISLCGEAMLEYQDIRKNKKRLNKKRSP
ncbi:MAG: hypothetical protein LBI04_12125, partial [Treponema sp.]|nr:hypothetical protein [Treponema sp.]